MEARGEAEVVDDAQVALERKRLRDVAGVLLELRDVLPEVVAEHVRDVGLDLEQADERPE